MPIQHVNVTENAIQNAFSLTNCYAIFFFNSQPMQWISCWPNLSHPIMDGASFAFHFDQLLCHIAVHYASGGLGLRAHHLLLFTARYLSLLARPHGQHLAPAPLRWRPQPPNVASGLEASRTCDSRLVNPEGVYSRVYSFGIHPRTHLM